MELCAALRSMRFILNGIFSFLFSFGCCAADAADAAADAVAFIFNGFSVLFHFRH